MTEEWCPWVQHDGAAPDFPKWARIIQCQFVGNGLKGDYNIPRDFPGFFWRWKSVKTGWFATEKRRVCDDPSFAPIAAYRIKKPSGSLILEKIAADPQPIDGTENQPSRPVKIGGAA